MGVKKKKENCCENRMVCVNPLCIQNHNVINYLNLYFAENPKAKINCKDFMEFQKLVRDITKKELKK